MKSENKSKIPHKRLRKMPVVISHWGQATQKVKRKSEGLLPSLWGKSEKNHVKFLGSGYCYCSAHFESKSTTVLRIQHHL